MSSFLGGMDGFLPILLPDTAFIHARYASIPPGYRFYSVWIDLAVFGLGIGFPDLARGEKNGFLQHIFGVFFGAFSRLYLYMPKMAKKANFQGFLWLQFYNFFAIRPVIATVKEM